MRWRQRQSETARAPTWLTLSLSLSLSPAQGACSSPRWSHCTLAVSGTPPRATSSEAVYLVAARLLQARGEIGRVGNVIRAANGAYCSHIIPQEPEPTPKSHSTAAGSMFIPATVPACNAIPATRRCGTESRWLGRLVQRKVDGYCSNAGACTQTAWTICLAPPCPHRALILATPVRTHTDHTSDTHMIALGHHPTLPPLPLPLSVHACVAQPAGGSPSSSPPAQVARRLLHALRRRPC